jgi:glycosyltransferase involved in cell wall biosynthesis
VADRNVALLCNNAAAVGTFRGPLIRALVEKGCRVHVFAPDFSAGTKEQVSALGAEPAEFGMDRSGVNPVKDLSVILRLAQRLKSLRIDTCLGFMTKLVIYGSLASFFAGVPNRLSMIEGLGYFFTEGPDMRIRKGLIRRIIISLYRMSLPLNRALFVLNPDDARDLATAGALGKTPVIVLDGIGVDIHDFAGEPPKGDVVKFILVGRLLSEKGVREYAAAAEKVKREHPSASFALVGAEDDRRGGIGAAEAREWVKRGIVEWPGALADVRPWLKSAGVCVLPSYYREGMPRTVLEAMAMSRPIITTDAPGCRETVQRLGCGEALSLKLGRFPVTGRVIQGRNGFLIPVRDVDALVEAMEYFIANPELLPRMGAESRRLAEDRFDVRKVNARILQEMG